MILSCFMAFPKFLHIFTMPGWDHLCYSWVGMNFFMVISSSLEFFIDSLQDLY